MCNCVCESAVGDGEGAKLKSLQGESWGYSLEQPFSYMKCAAGFTSANKTTQIESVVKTYTIQAVWILSLWKVFPIHGEKGQKLLK